MNILILILKPVLFFCLANLIYNPIFLMVNIEENPLYYAAIAGLIIGIATSLNYAFRKSVTGMSGMLYSTVTLDKSTFSFNHRRNAKKYRYYWRHDANRRHLL